MKTVVETLYKTTPPDVKQVEHLVHRLTALTGQTLSKAQFNNLGQLMDMYTRGMERDVQQCLDAFEEMISRGFPVNFKGYVLALLGVEIWHSPLIVAFLRKHGYYPRPGMISWRRDELDKASAWWNEESSDEEKAKVRGEFSRLYKLVELYDKAKRRIFARDHIKEDD